LHLSFLPLLSTYLTQSAPNLAFSFCEFPDLPNSDLACNPRHNALSLANRMTWLLTPNTFSRQTFLRAGVKTPIDLVPVPVAGAYFSLPTWERGQQGVIDCPCYLFPQPQIPRAADADPWTPAVRSHFGLRGARAIYKEYLRPRLNAGLDKYLCLARRIVAVASGSSDDQAPITHPVSPRLELSGVVYTAIFNPLEPRENGRDVLSAFLLALGNREDALLVIKLLTRPRQETAAFNAFLRCYQKFGLRHRCKLAVVTANLSDAQMLELARASAYYVQAPRAEGLALPLQNFLAAARPGISPGHTAMADYFRDDVGFLVAAHLEPICWPQDPDGGYTTTWYRVVWQSLYEQLQRSYAIAKEDRTRYLALAQRARTRVQSWAGEESVWPRLEAALDFAVQAAKPNVKRYAAVAKAS
jgi:hypothetical protein